MYKKHTQKIIFISIYKCIDKFWEHTHPSDNNGSLGTKDWGGCHHLLLREKHARKLGLVIN